MGKCGAPQGETLEELKNDIERINAALQKPVLEYVNEEIREVK